MSKIVYMHYHNVQLLENFPGTTADDVVFNGFHTTLPRYIEVHGTTGYSDYDYLEFTVTEMTFTPQDTSILDTANTETGPKSYQRWMAKTVADDFAIPGPALPNLLDMSVSDLSATSVVAGSQLTVSASLGNGGNADAPAEHIGFYISSDSNFPTEGRFLVAIGVGALTAHTHSATYSGIPLTIPADLAPGKYYIRAVADYDRKINETTDDDNASAAVAIEIKAAPTNLLPGMDKEVTFISGVTSSAAVAGVSYFTWSVGTNPISYRQSPGDTSRAAKWGGTALSTSGTPGGTVEYSFDPGWSSEEMSALTKGLKLWEAEANISFVYVSNSAAARVIFTKNAGEHSAYTTSHPLAPTTAVGSSSDALAGKPGQAVHVSIDMSYAPLKVSPLSVGAYGNDAMHQIIHEEGHMLGLGHGGAYDSAQRTQFSEYDSRQWTVMSYINPWDTTQKSPVVTDKTSANPYPWGLSSDGYNFLPTTPMILDIVAVQRIYGAATSGQLATGNQTFGFHTTITGEIKEFFDFDINTNPVITIWARGTHNTLDLSKFTADADIDLTPGGFVSANGMVHNIGIAFETIIETAIGGFGNDVFWGLAGKHEFDGGASGADRVNYSKASAAITVDLTAGTASNGFGGTDKLFSIEQVIGSRFNDQMTAGSVPSLLVGGDGNDTYYVKNSADQVIENGNEGTGDIVISSVDYTLPANVEALRLAGATSSGFGGGAQLASTETSSLNLPIVGTGVSANLNGAGNNSDNALYGNSGNNNLDGKGGNDYMVGGAGNDIYFADSSSDVVVENSAEGSDIVYASVDYTIGVNVESVVLQGAANLNAAGNSQDNALYGNSGNNNLDGKGGNDYMVGGAGNDIYFVDSSSDVVVEKTGEGTADIVYATIDYTIGANVESVVLQGTANLNAAGSSDNNALIGNSGNNNLDGKGGNDYMVGGAGNDTYFVDSSGDGVVEKPGEGTDTVHASINYTLPANVDALILDGTANLSGIGNGDANALVGNSGANTLDGKGGKDFLTGNGGNDTFRFQSGDANGDIISDFNGNGTSAGDSFLFVGYGTAAQGATFTHIGTGNQWQIHSGLDGHNEVITLQNGASVVSSDYLFQ